MSKVIVDIAGHKPYDVRIATGAIEGSVPHSARSTRIPRRSSSPMRPLRRITLSL